MSAINLRAPGRKKMAPNICASLKLLLTFIVIIIQLLGLLNAGQLARSRPRATHTQSDINSGCDLLFTGDTGAQDFCQCRDSAPIGTAPGGGDPQPPAAPNDDLSSASPIAAISQLDCRHDNASELLGALTRALAGQSGPRVKLDYLNIQANVTYADGELARVKSTGHLAQVDQLTATLAVTGSASNAENLLATLVDQLFEPNQLQSLTLVIIEAALPSGETLTAPRSLKLNHLLEKLTSLSRLEVSVSADDHAHHGATTLELDSTSLGAHLSHSLQWLNLAANSRLNLSGTPLARLNALEYLNLESSHLGAFHLYDLVTGQSHPSLSSLNLARNELGSLGRDLFCCSPRTPAAVLPSLSQLDLSHNRLASISAHEAHLILVSFPQLANLYLQHNQIVHLNLNALLGTDWHRHLAGGLRAFEDENSTFHDGQPTGANQTSKLEFIDLSHNELLALTGFSRASDTRTEGGPRIRSINLAHNRLRQPISLISPKLVNLLVFAESLEFKQQVASSPIVSLNSLGTIFDLAGGENITSSLCDYLSIGPAADGPTQADPSTDESFLTELLLGHNELARLEPGDFAGASCQRLETLALNDNSLAHIAPGAFDLLTHLQRLDLSANQLAELPARLFHHLSELRVLNLAGNKLAKSFTLPPLAHLQELYLRANALESWQVGSNATSALKILDLSHNKLAHHLTPLGFNHLNELTHLNLEGNKQLREFNWLDLFRAPLNSGGAGSNELSRVDSAEHQGRDRKTKKRKKGAAQRVETADRKTQRRRSARSSAGAHAQDVELDYSQSAGAISVLNLRDNRLVTFGPPVVSAAIHCDSLTTTLQLIRVLDLSHNSMRELGNNSFACFRALELLDLSSNHLRTLNELALGPLAQLKHLLLANNYLVHLDGNFLTERLLPRLRRLDCSQNQLSSLNLSAGLAGPVELEHLNLSDNFNLKLDSSELLALLRASSATLRQLKLARIASIWTNVLVNDSALQFDLELESLDLGQVSRMDSNFWKYLGGGRLSAEKLALCPPTRENLTLAKLLGHTKLRQLDLSRCQLTNSMLKRAGFDGHSEAATGGGENNTTSSGVTRLNLSHNKLGEWPPLVGSLVDLDLSHNQLAGRLFRSLEHINLNQLASLNLSSNVLTNVCGEENDAEKCQQVVASSFPQLRHLDLSHNKLTSLPVELINKRQHLEMIWLSHNQLTLVAPPNGGSGQQLALAARVRMLDLSFNERAPGFHVSSPARQANALDGEPLPPVIASGLIIHRDAERAVIGCSHSSDFIRVLRGRSSVRPITSWPGYAGEREDYLGPADQSSNQAEMEVTCPTLRELKLDDSTWSAGLNLTAASSWLGALSSAGSQIRTIGELSTRLAPASRARVVYLDLTRNAVESSLALDEIWAHFPSLQTLEMARQTNLQEVSLHHFAGDRARLAYVNLSHNKLRLIKPGLGRANQPLDSLLVLRLDHNHLRDFSEDLLRSLPNLRYLDLRANQIVQLDALTSAPLTNPLLDMVLDQPPPPVNRYEVQLTRDMNALKIGSIAPTANQTFGLEVSVRSEVGRGHSAASVQLNRTSHVLRFCTLNRAELYKVCLRKPEALGPRQPVCFALKPPPRGSSCTTNIADPDQRANDSVQTRTESLMSSVNKTGTPESDAGPHDDPVLSFIDQLKWAWLRVKQFDLAVYLAQVSQVNQDSVLVTINGRHPIYTLTVIKLGLVLAALCVILLSIAMFALLTATVIGGGGGGGGASSKRQKLRRQNKVSDQESAESSYEQVASRAGSGKGECDDETTTTSGGGGGGCCATKSQDTSEGSRYSRNTIATTSGSTSGSVVGTSSSNLDTVREVEHRLQAAAAAATATSAETGGSGPGHQHHHHLFNQHNCSTPSSSLAPSSVETGETMQAVDSLQSCSFTRAQRREIYDSQRTLTAASGQAHFNSVDQYQQQAGGAQVSPAPLPPPPVATVMRMVKSSTFDGVGASMAPSGLVSAGFAHDALHGAQQPRGYGTLRNQRQLYSAAGCNYSSLARPVPPLRSQFGPQMTTETGNRLLPPEQRQNYVPVQSMSFNGGELDPATLSLLSLNSQLSGGGGGGCGGHSANNGSGQSPGGEQVAPASAASLCQYHTRQQAMQRARDQQRQQEQHRELLLLAEELQHRHHSSATVASAATVGGNGTLFELDEEVQLAADWRSGCEQRAGADYPLAPPPPPSP